MHFRFEREIYTASVEILFPRWNFTKSRVDERDSKENIYFSAGKDK